jgi:DNA-binding transcriptional ArsR family regulator
MPRESRRRITEPEAIEALAHPVRLELIDYLMAQGPATASTCARAVGDTPSNCSYHLRVLAKVGLVEEAVSEDGRERPWRALITGFDADVDDEGQLTPQAAELLALTLQRDQRMVRDYLARRDEMPKRWRASDVYSNYTLRLTAQELRDLTAKLDGLIRPYIAATREDSPRGSALVHLGLQAFPTEAPR